MKTSRIVTIVVVSLIIAIWIVAIPWYEESTAAQSKVVNAILYMGSIREALDSACSGSKFQAVSKLSDVGIPEPDPMAYVLRSEFQRMALDRVRVIAVLPEIRVEGLFPTIAVTEGSTIAFDYVCSQGGTVSMQFTDSTISARYLPSSMRK